MSKYPLKSLHGKINIKHGFAFKGEFFSDKGEYILITPGNFFEKGGFKRLIGKEKYYLADYPEEYLHKKDDLVVAMTEQAAGLLGSCALIPESNIYLHNQRIGFITMSPEVMDKHYVYYLFMTKNVRNQIRQSSSGSKVKHTSPERIYDVIAPIPNQIEQKKISKVLASLDKKISINNQIHNELKEMSKLIYDYWFVQFDFPNEEGKPYKSSGGNMTFNQELKREIPDGWGVDSLLEIATFTNGIACQKFRPQEGDEFLKVIKIREMGSGFTEKSEFVSNDIPKKVIVKNGDVLFSWSATLDIKIWTGGIGGLNQHIFKVTSKKYPRTYYYFEILRYLQHFKMLAELRKTTMGHITQDHLKQSRITIPPSELIEKLHNKLDPLLNKMVKINEENIKLIQIRDWLLPMLINGQITVIDSK